jgi:hypothetical protein
MMSTILRRLIPALALIALPLTMMFVISEPASANTCTIAKNGDGFGKRRVCKFDGVHRVGASVRGVITWNYADNMKSGNFGLTLTDTAADGVCAWLKITTPGGTVWGNADGDFKACGNGTSRGVGATFNTSAYGDISVNDYNSGWYRFYLCTGKTTSCTKFWEQDIAQPNP